MSYKLYSGLPMGTGVIGVSDTVRMTFDIPLTDCWSYFSATLLFLSLLSVLDVEFAMHGERGMNPNSISPVSEEDDDGFIEDNYIPASERVRAERAAENMEDSEEEIDEIVFTIP